jgi:hypothetical protein
MAGICAVAQLCRCRSSACAWGVQAHEESCPAYEVPSGYWIPSAPSPTRPIWHPPTHPHLAQCPGGQLVHAVVRLRQGWVQLIQIASHGGAHSRVYLRVGRMWSACLWVWVHAGTQSRHGCTHALPGLVRLQHDTNQHKHTCGEGGRALARALNDVLHDGCIVARGVGGVGTGVQAPVQLSEGHLVRLSTRCSAGWPATCMGDAGRSTGQDLVPLVLLQHCGYPAVPLPLPLTAEAHQLASPVAMRDICACHRPHGVWRQLHKHGISYPCHPRLVCTPAALAGASGLLGCGGGGGGGSDLHLVLPKLHPGHD